MRRGVAELKVGNMLKLYEICYRPVHFIFIPTRTRLVIQHQVED